MGNKEAEILDVYLVRTQKTKKFIHKTLTKPHDLQTWVSHQ